MGNDVFAEQTQSSPRPKKEAPGERNCQEAYTGKTRNFTIEGDSEAAFSTWFKDELHECTAALQRQT